MKKSCCFFLALIFAFTFASVPTFATEANPNYVATMIENPATSEMLLEKAIQAFPEYASQLRGENLTETNFMKPYSANTNEIVKSETRAISENELVHYTEYANGVTLAALMTSAGKNIYNTESSGPATFCDLNAWLYCAGSSDVLLIEGVRCRYDINLNNSILGVGKVSKSNSAASPLRGTLKSSGTSASPAYVDYSAYFTVTISTGGAPNIYEQPGLLRILGTASVEAY